MSRPKSSETHFPCRHERSPENSAVRKDGTARCRQCKAEAAAEYRRTRADYFQRYRKAHRDGFTAYMKAWRAGQPLPRVAAVKVRLPVFFVPKEGSPLARAWKGVRV